MKINMPITNNEVFMKPGAILVTRTDLKGVITFANDAFVEISGYSRGELIGSPHNIVRHPDMLAVVYEEMWNTIKKGNPWHGLVKNRTKAGHFYWVNANVMPHVENGVAVGYISVRHAPSRIDISEAEQLYRKVATNPAVLHSTGVAAFCKKIKEVSLGKKLAFASALLAAPNIFLMSEFLNVADYGLLSIVAALTVLGGLIVLKVSNETSQLVKLSISELKQLSENKFSTPPNLRRDDQFGDLFRTIYGTSIKLGSDLGRLNQDASDALRIISGLENVQSSVLITNADLEIIFVNQSAKTLFSKVESDFKKQLPKFSVDKLLGSNIDVFHKSPEYQRQLLGKLSDSTMYELELAGHAFQIIAKPVISADGSRIGYIAEWMDRTQENKIEREIENLVNSIKLGI